MIEMAKDVAREIWKMAIQDTSYHNMQLKDIYQKKLQHEKRDLLKLVKDIISQHIQSSPQSFSSYLNLNSTYLGYNDSFVAF